MEIEALQMTPVKMSAQSHLGETEPKPAVKSFGEYLMDALGDFFSGIVFAFTPMKTRRADAVSAIQRELETLERRLLREAVGWLQQAKAHHDLIEELYRPAVDFAAVTRETELLCRELFTET